jgi:2-oxoglutarate dehydrogenase E1 component
MLRHHDDSRYSNAMNLEYIEHLWATYERAPQEVDVRWRQRFEELRTLRSTEVAGLGEAYAAEIEDKRTNRGDLAVSHEHNGNHQLIGSRRAHSAKTRLLSQQAAVSQLIASYRSQGHRGAALDPLSRQRRTSLLLSLEAHRLGESDLNATFFAGGLPGAVHQPLRDIVTALRETYCRSIGYEFDHLRDADMKLWLRRIVESRFNARPNAGARIRMLKKLVAAAEFESFMQTHFVGAKTFSLSGSESIVPLLDAVIEGAAAQGVREIVLAMAHRGRLNVLTNVLGKPPRRIFHEFRDEHPESRRGSGDVRYHLGFSGDRTLDDGAKIHLSLCFNPSHLEFVNPVALGRLKAKQQRASRDESPDGMAVMLHGDASFAGEGVVQEMFNLSALRDYDTGGALHVIVNNQLGFTTPPEEGRATEYASDIARAFDVPVFHVNGDDVDAVVHVAELALAFRRRFRRDVVIDLWCYRRLGHNEVDEPAFTQPELYAAIAKTQPVEEAYSALLVDEQVLTADDVDEFEDQALAQLHEEFKAAAEPLKHEAEVPAGLWSGFVGGHEPEDEDMDTNVEGARLKQLLARLVAVPDGFHLHRKLEQGLARREEMVDGQRPLDWSTCEALAMASLAVEGHPVRLTGQDTARGTFSQRHAVWHDQENGRQYMPLAHLAENQARVDVVNSPLCEAAALGFEYGFSLDYPEALVAWEAQFGDFWNAGQVIFDQFISSAHDKWSRLSGLVMLLPHGFEGQGPEHSSARLERFLTSAAEDNIQVVYPSTPAQLFHCLRRQVLRQWRAPLVMLTPKSMLRHHAATSTWDELAQGRFHRVLADADLAECSSRVIACTGKIFYELDKVRTDAGRDDIGILRIEQLYPFPEKELREALASLRGPTSVYWVQEEPENMGAANYVLARWTQTMPREFPLLRITRRASASPATGSSKAHKLEQRELIARGLGMREANGE